MSHNRARKARTSRRNAFLNSDRSINQAINLAVADHLVKVLDESAIRLLDALLRSQHGVSFDRLAEDPQRLAEALYDLFGPAADTIAKIMLITAYRTFGIEPDSEILDCDHRYLKAGLDKLKQDVKKRTFSQSYDDLR
jgi:hypothetical protein